MNSDPAPLEAATRRFADRARAAGLAVDIVQHAQSTRTAEDAAVACGCAVGQIVKSLVFRGLNSQRPYLLLVSGANRVDEQRVADQIGEPIVRPDARFVREVTGYAIGGIPPLGHDIAMATYFDRDLMQFPVIWAAAGTPRSVFAVAPSALLEKSRACVLDLR